MTTNLSQQLSTLNKPFRVPPKCIIPSSCVFKYLVLLKELQDEGLFTSSCIPYYPLQLDNDL